MAEELETPGQEPQAELPPQGETPPELLAKEEVEQEIIPKPPKVYSEPEFKGIQRELDKRNRRIAELEAQQGQLSSLQQEVQDLNRRYGETTLLFADTLDRLGGVEEETQEPARQSTRSRVEQTLAPRVPMAPKELSPEQKAFQEEQAKAGIQIVDILAEADIESSDPEVLEKVVPLFLKGNRVGAKREAMKLYDRKIAAKNKEIDADNERRKTARVITTAPRGSSSRYTTVEQIASLSEEEVEKAGYPSRGVMVRELKKEGHIKEKKE